MITLDTNLVNRQQHYYFLLQLKRNNAKAYQNIDEYSEAHSAKGTPEANKTEKALETEKALQAEKTLQAEISKDVSKVFPDIATLIKELKLELPRNKWNLLKLFPADDLMKMMSLLGPKHLLKGLKLFAKEQLLKFVYNLPKEFLLKMLFQMFPSKEELVKLLPIKELNRFLSSKKLEKSNFVNVLSSMPPHVLAQILESVLGTPQDGKSNKEMLGSLNQMKSGQIANGVKSLNYKEMRTVINSLLKSDESLYMQFQKDSLFAEILKAPKSTLIESMNVIPPDKLIDMLGTLPTELMAIVVTQVDTEVFASILLKSHQNLLAQLIA